MPSAADWVDTGAIFLIRHPDVDYASGEPIYTRKTYDAIGRYVERRFKIAAVNFIEITEKENN